MQSLPATVMITVAGEVLAEPGQRYSPHHAPQIGCSQVSNANNNNNNNDHIEECNLRFL